MRFLIQWRIMPNATWLNHHIDNYYISNERSLRISLFIHTHLQQSSLRIFFSPPFLFSLISLAGKGIPLCSGKKKPIGTDARPLTDNPTWVLSQTNCKWFGHLVWRVACGRRARDYSRIRHRRSLEISVCMYTCVCMCVCVIVCKSSVLADQIEASEKSIRHRRTRSKAARIGRAIRGSSRFAFLSKATRLKKVNIH